MIDRQELRQAVGERVVWLRRGLLAILLALTAYLFDIQVVRTAEFQALADLNSMKRVRVPAPRGLLLDRDGRVLVKNRPAFEAVVYPDRIQDVEATLSRARSVLGLDARYAERLRKRLRRKVEPEVLLKEDLSLAEVAAIEARAWEWPEFRVRQGLVRSYPFGSAAAHVLGHMGEIREEQLQEPRFQHYDQGDIIGQTGIEARYEAYLRGRDGVRRVMVNNRGREIRELDRIDSPVPGLDLRLTIDLDVQKAAEDAFGELRGAAVAIDNSTGEVLALVSRPAYDPNAFAGRLTREDWVRYNADPAHPMFDRALLGKLPPGSVFKIVDAVAGLQDRIWDPDQSITCVGSTVLYGDVRRCWKKEGHGTVAFKEAMRGSCNVYFYHRGDALGIDRIARWARQLGLGELAGIDVDPEGRGVVPDPVWKRRVRAEPWWPGETVSVAIGQGALGVSVLQIAQMMQVVANGGRAYAPYVVQAAGPAGFRRAPVVAREVALRPDVVERLQESLHAVVNEPHGTGGRARIEGFAVSGKTGTAQTPAQGIDPADAKEHAWFTGFAPGKAPAAVVAVFVEHGGHGGEAAAPIAGAMLARILEKKGLKPPAEPAIAASDLVAELPRPVFIGPPGPGERPARVVTTAAFIGPPRERRSGTGGAAALSRALPIAAEPPLDGLAWAATPSRPLGAGAAPAAPVTPPTAAPATGPAAASASLSPHPAATPARSSGAARTSAKKGKHVKKGKRSNRGRKRDTAAAPKLVPQAPAGQAD